MYSDISTRTTKYVIFLILIVIYTDSHSIELKSEVTDPRDPSYNVDPDLLKQNFDNLVSAKERTVERLLKNDFIARIVTDPLQSYEKAAENSKKNPNKSFMEDMRRREFQAENCGKFDIQKLLQMVQLARENSENRSTEKPFDPNKQVAEQNKNVQPKSKDLFSEFPGLNLEKLLMASKLFETEPLSKQKDQEDIDNQEGTNPPVVKRCAKVSNKRRKSYFRSPFRKRHRIKMIERRRD